MDDDKKQQIATFRFGVIHDLVGHIELEPGEQERLIREKCSRKWVIPFSEKTYISRSTILRWVRLYKDSGGRLESLCTQDRSDQGMSRAMDQETSLALMRLREELPNATVPRLIQEMDKRRLVSPGVTLNASTLYRFLHGHDLMELTTPLPEDRRRFEAELPNDMWQVDCMHGPRVEHGSKQRKTYLIAFMDDHSRLVTHGEFFLSESVKSFLVALQGALMWGKVEKGTFFFVVTVCWLPERLSCEHGDMPRTARSSIGGMRFTRMTTARRMGLEFRLRPRGCPRTEAKK